MVSSSGHAKSCKVCDANLNSYAHLKVVFCQRDGKVKCIDRSFDYLEPQIMSLAGVSLADVSRTPAVSDFQGRDLSQTNRNASERNIDLHSVKKRAVSQESSSRLSMWRDVYEKILGSNTDPSSEEILSGLLHLFVKQDDALELAKRLLNRFGGIGALLTARVDHLLDACSGQHECMYFLKLLYMAMRRALREPIEEKLHIADQLALQDYLQLTMKHERSRGSENPFPE